MKPIIKTSIILGMTSCLMACGSQEKTETLIEQPVAVVAHQVELQEVSDALQFSGQVVSHNQTVLSTKIMGQVSSVRVKAGDHVSKGDLLVTIKSKEVQSQLASAKAMLDEALAANANALKGYERIQNLKAKGSSTQHELDQAIAGKDMAQARVEAAEHQVSSVEELLSYANLRSPIDGFISVKYVNPGDMASPGSPLLALESAQQLKIDIGVPEFEVGLFNEGDEVSIYLNALANQKVKGVVDKVIPSSAFSGAQFKVSVLMQDTPKGVKPGMYGRVTRDGATRKKVVVSDSTLVYKGQLTGIYVISDQDEALLRWVRLGRQTDKGYVVLSGLDAGERYIVSGANGLKDGMKVITTKSN